MIRHALTDAQWAAIADLFPEPATTGRPPIPARQALNGIIWLNNKGAKSRDIPESLGHHRTDQCLSLGRRISAMACLLIDRLLSLFSADMNLSGVFVRTL